MSFCRFLFSFFFLFLLTTLGKDRSCWTVYSIVAVVQHDDGPEVSRTVVSYAFGIWHFSFGWFVQGSLVPFLVPFHWHDRCKWWSGSGRISEIGRTMWVLSGVSRARVH